MEELPAINSLLSESLQISLDEQTAPETAGNRIHIPKGGQHRGGKGLAYHTKPISYGSWPGAQYVSAP